jgi:cytochrome c peroxidase
MRKAAIAIIGAGACALLLTTGCAKKDAALDEAKLKMFAPLPDTIPAKAGGPLETRVALGRMLYFDTRLSRNQKIACNSCHDLTKFGVDNEATSEGHKKQRGDRNSPTVYNAAAHFVQFWDGRAADVEEQAKGPVLNPVEMAMGSDKDVVKVLKTIPEYVDQFKKAFPDSKDPVTYENMANAIGTFERGLLTPSRWDKFLKGDRAALTPEEIAGFAAYTTAGCQTCHAGALLGGNLYQKLGVMKPYPDATDPGRFKVTKSEGDRMMFKVPSLRNIEKTGPYYHNGKVVSLEQAVGQMGEYQLGRELNPTEVKAIITFLKTLTGDVPAEYIKKPELPKSTPQTPKPQETD